MFPESMRLHRLGPRMHVRLEGSPDGYCQWIEQQLGQHQPVRPSPASVDIGRAKQANGDSHEANHCWDQQWRESPEIQTPRELGLKSSSKCPGHFGCSSRFTISLTIFPSTRMPAALNLAIAFFITVPISFMVGAPISAMAAFTPATRSASLAALGR